MHSFDPKIAQQVGVNAAVIYQNIRWWCEKNAANEKNVIDGHVWSYNSVRAFTRLFPYLTAKQVRTALEILEDEGLILVANYNADPRDRTKWYAVAGHEIPPEEQSEPDAGSAPEGEALCPAGQNTSAPEGEPLPVGKPFNKPVVKHTPPTPRDAGGLSGATSSAVDLLGDTDVTLADTRPRRPKKIVGGLHEGCRTLDDEFERVWKHHPRKVGKGAARRAWARARRKASYGQITDPLGLWIKLQRSTPIEKLPHFATWLNQERWLDDQMHAVNRAETTSDRLDRLGATSTEAEGDGLSGPTRTPPEIKLRID